MPPRNSRRNSVAYKASSCVATRLTAGRQLDKCELPELDLGPFRLQGDLTMIGGALSPGIHQSPTDPGSLFAANRPDYHGVPLAGRFLGVVGAVEDAPCLTLRRP